MKELVTILQGDWIGRLRELPEKSVQCCVTSPPYWALRDYGVNGQLGLEQTPEEYVAKLVVGFREVHRVLRDDGTLWLNLGDNYSSNAGKRKSEDARGPKQCTNRGSCDLGSRTVHGLRSKNIVGVPWRVAFALQSDGWFLRSDIIWHKANPMPESVTDRPTKAHEYIFLLTKRPKYFYDADAIKEPVSGGAHARKANGKNSRMVLERAAGREHSKLHPSRSNIPGVTPKSAAPGSGIKANESFHAACVDLVKERNKRSVWTVATSPYKGAHFATFPPALIKPCILAGSRIGDTILDPFAGSGTTGKVALDLGRKAILIELNSEYISLIRQRTFITPNLAFQ